MRRSRNWSPIRMKYRSSEGLKDKRWERLREFILARDQYLDQEAKRYGKRMEANHVHHIFPREFFPEWQYEPWNLISLSLKTHNEMHDRETHKLTEKGWQLLVRTARRNGLELDPSLKERIKN